MKDLFERHKAEFRKELLEKFDSTVKSYMDLDMFTAMLPISEPKKAAAKRPRIRKHAHKLMTRQDADDVRSKFGTLKMGSQVYTKKRDELARSTGFSRRQISAAVNGLDRAAARKKPVTTKKR